MVCSPCWLQNASCSRQCTAITTFKMPQKPCHNHSFCTTAAAAVPRYARELWQQHICSSTCAHLVALYCVST
jgi:hypothetical protein